MTYKHPATAVGWSLLQAADAAAARAAIGIDASTATATNQFAATIGNGSATSIAVTHGLGTRDVVVSVYDVATGEQVECDVVATTGDVVTLTFATAPATNTLRCVVLGTAFGLGASGATTSGAITDATIVGRQVLTATDAAAARTAIGAGSSNLAIGTTALTAKAGDYQPSSANISDSTAVGRSLITAADAAAARTVLGSPSNSYSATIGNGSSTSIAVTHNLGTSDIVVSVSQLDNGKIIACDVVKTNGNVATLNFDTAPALNSLRCTIIGTAFGVGSPVPTSSVSITDATTTGRSLVTATDAAAARTAIGAGTSSLALGTTSSTAKAGDYQPSSANISDSTVTGRALVTAADASAARTAQNISTVMVEDYRDGIRTDLQIIQAAFTAATAGSEIRFGAGVTYTLTGSEYLDIYLGASKSDLLVNGQGATISTSSPDVYSLMRIQGSRYTTGQPTLSSPVAARSKTITVSSTAGILAGDVLRIESTHELFAHDADPLADGLKTEMVIVREVVDGTTLTLEQRTADTYSIAGGTVNVWIYRPVRNLTIRDLNFKGVRHSDPDEFSAEQYGLWVRSFAGVKIESCTLNGTGNAGIMVQEGIDATITNCVSDNNNFYPVTGGSAFYARHCNGVKFIGCSSRDSRHAIDTDYSRDITYLACSATGTGAAAFSTHQNVDGARIINCSAYECGGGIIIRSRNTLVQGNRIYGSKIQAEQPVAQTYVHGIIVQVGNGGVGLVIDSNYIDIDGPDWSAREDLIASGITLQTALKDCQITNNHIKGFPWHGIHHTGDGGDGVLISENSIDCSSQLAGNTRCGIKLTPAVAANGNYYTDLVIDSNVIRQGSVHSGIYVSGGYDSSNRSDRIRLRNNEIGTCGNAKIFLDDGYYGSDTVASGNNANSIKYTAANWTGVPYVSGNRTLVSSYASTATGVETIQLTVDDAQVQIFTGGSSQAVRLPTTYVTAGRTWTVLNNSTNTVTVSSSDGSTVVAIGQSRYGMFTAAVDTPTTAANWRVVSPSDSLVANTVAQRDTNGWLWGNGIVSWRTSTVTVEAGTTTLTAASTQVQVFTGGSSQTVKLPTTSIYAGMQYTIVNQSTGDVTVQSSAANTIATMTGGAAYTTKVFIALKDTPTTDTHWRAI